MDKLPVFCLVASWAVVLISIYLEIISSQAWIFRSGSLMVLFAVVAEYNLLKGRDEHHRDQLIEYASTGQVNFDRIHPSKSHQRLETISHVTVIIGTLIWGYGDMLLAIL